MIQQFITTNRGEMTESINSEHAGHVAKRLTQEEIEKMRVQDSRLVPEFRANQLEKDAKKHWDLFYKRNETRFFKDRHWTTREFSEFLNASAEEHRSVLLEVGCGVGNFVFPLIEDGLKFGKIFACDFSPRAVELTKVYPRLLLLSNASVSTFALIIHLAEPRALRSGKNESIPSRYHHRKLLHRCGLPSKCGDSNICFICHSS